MSRNKPRRNPQNREFPRDPSSPSGVLHAASYYEGVIPPPEDMAHYEEISPGFADRILRMAENEGDHRREMEKKMIRGSINSTILGSILGFLSVIIICLLCYYGFKMGYPNQAATIATTVIIGLAAVFIRNKGKQKK